jgi:hypothetical protein
MGGIQAPSTSFCLYVAALSVYRASNVWDRMQELTPCAKGSLQVSRTVTTSFV